jgi:hypothetical protein
MPVYSIHLYILSVERFRTTPRMGTEENHGRNPHVTLNFDCGVYGIAVKVAIVNLFQVVIVFNCASEVLAISLLIVNNFHPVSTSTWHITGDS